MMRDSEKVRENRVRRMADRQGYLLKKSRVRDPNALTYGTYLLADKERNFVVYADWDSPRSFGLDLDDVEHWLTSPKVDEEPPKKARQARRR